MSDNIEDQPGERGGRILLIVLLVAGVFMALGSLGVAGFFLVRAGRSAAERVRDAEAQARQDELVARGHNEENAEAKAEHRQFEKIAVALADSLKANEHLSDSFSKDGRPLLSWRVHLLPRLGHADLYRRFKLDEPWDGPTNRRLIKEIPAVYDPPNPRKEWAPGLTLMRAFDHEGAIFEPPGHLSLRDISAGADDTLLIFDAGAPIEWTRPDGLIWKPEQPRSSFGGTFPQRDSFLAATAAGKVCWVKKSLTDDTLRALFERRRDKRPKLRFTGDMRE